MGISQSAGRALAGCSRRRRALAEFSACGLSRCACRRSSGPITYGLVTWLTAGNHRIAILSTGAVLRRRAASCCGAVDVERGTAAALSRGLNAAGRTPVGGKIVRSFDFVAAPVPEATPRIVRTPESSTSLEEHIHEGAGTRQAGRRLQRQGARQVRRQRRRHRQRQDEHEPLRRDRRRGSGAAAREGRRHRGHRRVVRRHAVPGNAAHRDGDRRRPRDPGRDAPTNCSRWRWPSC